MKTGLELCSINVFICSDTSRQQIPSESKHYALVLTIDVFKRLKLNNRGLTKDELIDLKYNRHVKHTENVYGSGDFARVKRS